MIVDCLSLNPLTGALKCYLRELPEPPVDLWALQWLVQSSWVCVISTLEIFLILLWFQVCVMSLVFIFTGKKTWQRNWSSSKCCWRNCHLTTTTTSGLCPSCSCFFLPHEQMSLSFPSQGQKNAPDSGDPSCSTIIGGTLCIVLR